MRAIITKPTNVTIGTDTNIFYKKELHKLLDALADIGWMLESFDG